MPISHADIEPQLSNAQEAFRHGGQTTEEGLDVSSADLVQLRKACRLLSGAERLLHPLAVYSTVFTAVEQRIQFLW